MKKLFFIEIVVLFLMCKLVFANSIICYQPMNGNANDISGNGYNGVSGSATGFGHDDGDYAYGTDNSPSGAITEPNSLWEAIGDLTNTGAAYSIQWECKRIDDTNRIFSFFFFGVEDSVSTGGAVKIQGANDEILIVMSTDGEKWYGAPTFDLEQWDTCSYEWVSSTAMVKFYWNGSLKCSQKGDNYFKNSQETKLFALMRSPFNTQGCYCKIRNWRVVNGEQQGVMFELPTPTITETIFETFTSTPTHTITPTLTPTLTPTITPTKVVAEFFSTQNLFRTEQKGSYISVSNVSKVHNWNTYDYVIFTDAKSNTWTIVRKTKNLNNVIFEVLDLKGDTITGDFDYLIKK
jgi:hypothetical protein